MQLTVTSSSTMTRRMSVGSQCQTQLLTVARSTSLKVAQYQAGHANGSTRRWPSILGGRHPSEVIQRNRLTAIELHEQLLSLVGRFLAVVVYDLERFVPGGSSVPVSPP